MKELIDHECFIEWMKDGQPVNWYDNGRVLVCALDGQMVKLRADYSYTPEAWINVACIRSLRRCPTE